ncbi:MAG: N-acetylmuramoyl-L-alanine amidase [Actinomycetota bacterium]
MTLPLTWMAAAFRKNGLNVKEVSGWRTRGRPYNFAPRGVIFHHTASNPAGGSAPALNTVTHGRSDLPGPLCNALVGRDGTVYVIAAGYANHAGTGGPFNGVPQDSGNAYLAGVEVENNGLGEAWPKRQLDACDVVFATLLIGMRRKAVWVCGHKEWAPGRKPDPNGIDMNRYRGRVRAEIRRIASGGKPKPKPKPKPHDGRTYEVEAGDTLWSIAQEFRMSVAELKDRNNLTSDTIRVGDKLKV